MSIKTNLFYHKTTKKSQIFSKIQYNKKKIFKIFKIQLDNNKLCLVNRMIKLMMI